MRQVQITIVNRLGLHARPAAKLVTLASKFESEVTLVHKNHAVNAKSIMAIMMLAACQGAELALVAKGRDEDLAVEKIVELFQGRFGEME